MFKTFKTSSQQKSPLRETMRVVSHGKKSQHKPELALALPLTSLIDAFSIIVIYLLIGTQSGALEVPIQNNMQLPLAANSKAIESVTNVLKIENKQFSLNDEKFEASQLTAKLSELKQKNSDKSLELIIQADQEMQYADLDPLIKAGSLAGVDKLKFAVMPTK